MPITSYIADDEHSARERLSFLIQEFIVEELQIIGQCGNPLTALNEIIELAPELAFLDVEMPKMSGLELAEKLQASGYKGKIIFITAFDHYAIKSLRAKAFDYILKPVDVDEQAYRGYTSPECLVENRYSK